MYKSALHDAYRTGGGRIIPTGVYRGGGQPLEDSDFYASFARLSALGRPSEKQVIDWTRKYGLLVPGEGTDLEDFRCESRNAHQLLGLYRDVMTQDVGALRDRFVRPENVFPQDHYPRTEVERAFTSRPEGSRVIAGLPDGDLISSAAAIFEHLLADKVRSVRLGFEQFVPQTWTEDKTYADEPEMLEHMVSKHGEKSRAVWARQQIIWTELEAAAVGNYHPAPSYRCPDLRAALYLQLYLMVTDRRPTRICESPICRQPFFPANKRQRCCNPTCRSNARHYREKQAQSDQVDTT